MIDIKAEIKFWEIEKENENHVKKSLLDNRKREIIHC
jgi:hypothetical protein